MAIFKGEKIIISFSLKIVCNQPNQSHFKNPQILEWNATRFKQENCTWYICTSALSIYPGNMISRILYSYWIYKFKTTFPHKIRNSFIYDLSYFTYLLFYKPVYFCANFLSSFQLQHFCRQIITIPYLPRRFVKLTCVSLCSLVWVYSCWWSVFSFGLRPRSAFNCQRLQSRKSRNASALWYVYLYSNVYLHLVSLQLAHAKAAEALFDSWLLEA